MPDDPAKPERQPDRRQFLVRTASAAGAVGLASLCGGGCALFHKRTMHVEAPEQATSVRLAYKDHPRLGTPHGSVLVEGRDGDARVIVIRRPDGQLVALALECTHVGCDLDYVKATAELECPCHGSRFDLEGKVLEGPADEPLARYPLTEEADAVTVDLTPMAAPPPTL